VSDGALISSPSNISLALVANSTPIVNAGAPQTIGENTLVTLHGSAVDPDGDPVTIAWDQISDPMMVILDHPDTLTPSFLAPLVGAGGADLSFRLKADDNYLWNPKSAEDTVTVHVENTNDPPSCNLAMANIGILWPPNHKLIPINITNVTDPNNESVTINITSVTQDEPVNGLGDGDTSPDAYIQNQSGTATQSVLLRSERAGGGDGRIYRINFTASDGIESCNGSVKVQAPISLKKPAIDGGQTVDSTHP
jgi:hypothetical protein